MSPVHSRVVSTFIRPLINLGYGNDSPDGINTLSELIEFAATHNPNHIFGLQARANSSSCTSGKTFGSGGDLSFCEITFVQLRRVVERASAWALSSGAAVGRMCRTEKVSPVAIFLSSDVTVFIYMAALLRIGVPVLVLSARLSPSSIVHLLQETRASTVLTSTRLSRTADEARTLLRADSIIKFTSVPSFFDLDQQGDPIKIPHVFSDYAYDGLDAIILHTSGTTGLPKAIYHAQAYVLLYATCHRLPPQQEPFPYNVSTLPIYHGFGLLAPCLSLSIGMPFVLLPSSTIPTACSVLTALRRTGARCMLTVPSIVEDILRSLEADGLEILCRLEILVIGGAPMKESVLQELAKARVNILNHWGATEIGPIVPIERPKRGYDGRYLVPRTDLNLTFAQTQDGDTFRLIGKAPGWKEPYVVQDLLLSNPRDRNQLRILGRADDLLVLATGEKVRPAALEKEISQHPCVKDTIAFGEGKFELGVIIELAKGIVPLHVNLDMQDEVLKIIARLGLEGYIQSGNNYVEGHGKIARDMVVFTREDDKPLKRTDKGSLARKANYASFDKEIKKCYKRLEVIRGPSIPMPDEGSGMTLRVMIRNLVRGVGVTLEADDVDFFDAGMDSLQATRLQRAVVNRLQTAETTLHAGNFPTDFIYANPSVDQLYLTLSSILEGSRSSSVTHRVSVSREECRIAAMEAMTAKYKHVLAGFRNIALRAKSRQMSSRVLQDKNVVLLTGSTGSLGCYLLARLAQDPVVNTVICLNRSASIDLKARQLAQLQKHRVVLSKRDWAKVVLYECNLSRENLGLGKKVTRRLLSVTHIVHNAWPVNFNWALSSFEPHIKGLVNLLRFALEIASWRGDGRRVRFIFTSTIAVVANYPLLNPNGPSKVPEIPFGPPYTANMGYAEAKWVCEELVISATRMYGIRLRGCCVRLGQLSGSEESGIWNEHEHFPVLVRMSRVFNALPLLEGSLSWLPLNRAARSIVELLFSQRYLSLYHIENPSRQSWKELLQTLVTILKEFQRQEITLTSYPEWLARLRALNDEPLAYSLLTFFETDFLQLATGGVILDTTRAAEDSMTLMTSGPLNKSHDIIDHQSSTSSNFIVKQTTKQFMSWIETCEYRPDATAEIIYVPIHK
ncbi:hypothetical protein APHAL10511_004204 [Amanita phalloides]|nr:hypothetical protein APHAL10511_004204 [Amanita phalloides]